MRTTRDWLCFARGRLGSLDLRPTEKEEIATELAAHLEDLYDEYRAQGLAESRAADRALNEVVDWRELKRRIALAKREEGVMNDRTRRFWLPGLASFSAAVICQAVLAYWSYQPHMLFRSHQFQLAYALWLIAQLFCGAVGAFLSRRAGGQQTARLAAALITSLILMSAMLAVVGISAMARVTGFWRQDFGSIDMAMLARAVATGVLIPSVALFLGALPFLSDAKPAAIVQ